MITAEEARRISGNESNIVKISKYIEIAANAGKKYITLDEWEIDVSDITRKLLQELGYKVEYSEGGSFDRAASLTISW